MRLSAFIRHLSSNYGHELRFVLPHGGMIEAHAHITEVGRVEKRFIDCGGTIRSNVYCSLQAWVADDVEHRLSPASLVAIIQKALPVLGSEDLEVEIEYEDGPLAGFPVILADSKDHVLYFHLDAKYADCLAKDVCVRAPLADSRGCSVGGCC